MPVTWAKSNPRVRTGDQFRLSLRFVNAPGVFNNVWAAVRVQYDDGGDDQFDVPVRVVSLTSDYSKQVTWCNRVVPRDGWVTDAWVDLDGATTARGQGYADLGVVHTTAGAETSLCSGYVYKDQSLELGFHEPIDFALTFVAQGTVAEDATAGTHVCTLTVTPGAGNEFQVMGGIIKVGNTATATQARVSIDDGVNDLMYLLNPDQITGAVANLVYPFPVPSLAAAVTAAAESPQGYTPVIVSGSMRLVLYAITAAVSVTQTFAVACRIKGALPTATLADTVGTPVLTLNTNTFFG